MYEQGEVMWISEESKTSQLTSLFFYPTVLIKSIAICKPYVFSDFAALVIEVVSGQFGHVHIYVNVATLTRNNLYIKAKYIGGPQYYYVSNRY